LNLPSKESADSIDQPITNNQIKQNQKTQMNDLNIINKPARQRGTTLIELSVVIAVLLLLVGVLFIGITAWKNGANTAACIVNLSSIQKAARGYQNLNALTAGAALTAATLQSAGFWATTPVCPTGTAYSGMTAVPSVGSAYATCTVASHGPSTTTLANW
jgi:prepilin-type N-terminal cleavage/methylation domain-containing protein